jgi:hypothetical protein
MVVSKSERPRALDVPIMERISKVDLCGHPGIGYILSVAYDAPAASCSLLLPPGHRPSLPQPPSPLAACCCCSSFPAFPLNPSKGPAPLLLHHLRPPPSSCFVSCYARSHHAYRPAVSTTKCMLKLKSLVGVPVSAFSGVHATLPDPAYLIWRIYTTPFVF